VAFVVDPLAETEGVFAWRDGKPAACPHYWVGKEVRVSDRGGSGDALRLSVPPGTAPAPPPPDAGLPLNWSGALRAALPYVLVFLIAWLLRGLQTDWERQRLVEGTVAHFGLWKGLRPGLEECLSGAEGDLQRISQRVGRLAKEHVELAGDGAAEKKQEWNDVQQALAQVGHFLGTVNRRYGFTPEERAAIEKYLLVKQAELQGLRVETKETPPSKPETPPKPEGPPKLDKPGKLDVPKPAAGEKTSTKPAPPAKTPEKK
jgi:hypothetical protein